jgi:two-component system OmpR family sensor kinase
MRRRPTVLVQVGGLALAALLAVLAISFGVVLLTPTPQSAPVRFSDVVTALRQPKHAAALGFQSTKGAVPPVGRDSPLLRSALAGALRVDPTSVHASWLSGRPAAVSDRSGIQTVTLIAGQEAVVTATPGGFSLRAGAAATLTPDALLPPLRAAIRQPDRRWLTLSPADPLLSAWRRRMLLAFLISATLLAPLAWLLARRITRPIRALAAAADRARLWQEETGLPVDGPREVAAAARAIADMHARLRAEAGERTRMVAAVAHDLRNPLTGLRLRAEAAAEPGRSRMIADIRSMEAMIRQMLDYARGHEARLRRVRTDLAALASACVDEARARGGTVLFSATAAVEAFVDPEAVARAVVNLLDNAARYAGAATVSVARNANGKGAVILVEDEGPGIPEGRMESVIRPFERLEPSRSRETGGAGLGLAIVRDVASAHRGSLQLRNRAGGGLSVALRLPAAEGESPFTAD